MSGFSSALSGYLSEGKDESHLDFSSNFGGALSPFLQAAEDAGHSITIYSGYRSPEHQDRLYQDAIAKYGSPEAARKWVAPPGKSQHNHGTAADLAYGSDEARQWAHSNAANFGLNFRMDYEPWHIELAPQDENAHSHFSAAALANAEYQSNSDAPDLRMTEDEAVATSSTVDEQARRDAKNVEASVAAAESEKQDAPTWKGSYAGVVQPSVTQNLESRQSNLIGNAARDFFNTLSPQQKMMEQQAYMNARRQSGESKSIQEWFASMRFPSYLTGFQVKDPQTIGNLSKDQQNFLHSVTTKVGGLDQSKMLGLT